MKKKIKKSKKAMQVAMKDIKSEVHEVLDNEFLYNDPEFPIVNKF